MNWALADTHCHLDFNKFENDRAAVIQRAREVGVDRILVPGIHLRSSRDCIHLARTDPMLYAAVGVHPNEASVWTTESRRELRNVILDDRTMANGAQGKIRAMGEIGLDYFWESTPPAQQKAVLQEQLTLASESGLPLVLHFREKGDVIQGQCSNDLLDLLTEWMGELNRLDHPLRHRPGVLHSFSGSLQTAQRAMGLGFCIGVTGPVTFKNARNRQAMIASLPLENLILETDAPFLAPHPHRGQRNEPSYVKLVAEKVAELKQITLDEVAVQTSSNARNLFDW